jgi:hypothetical protein
LLGIPFDNLSFEKLSHGLFDVCPAEVGPHGVDLCHCLGYGFGAVFERLVAHEVKGGAEADDVKVAVCRQTLEEEGQGLFCLVYATAAHRSAAIQQKEIFSPCCIQICLVIFRGQCLNFGIFESQLAELRYEGHHNRRASICSSQRIAGHLELLRCVGKHKILRK